MPLSGALNWYSLETTTVGGLVHVEAAKMQGARLAGSLAMQAADMEVAHLHQSAPDIRLAARWREMTETYTGRAL